MLVHYLNNNDGAWPTGWDDLRESFEFTNQGYGAPNLDWLKQRVAINFSFDPARLVSATTTRDKPLRVFALPDGSSNTDLDRANERILDHIRSCHVE